MEKISRWALSCLSTATPLAKPMSGRCPKYPGMPPVPAGAAKNISIAAENSWRYYSSAAPNIFSIFAAVSTAFFSAQHTFAGQGQAIQTLPQSIFFRKIGRTDYFWMFYVNVPSVLHEPLSLERLHRQHLSDQAVPLRRQMPVGRYQMQSF